MMPEAYIVDAVRSPVGKRNGGLAHVHPADLGAHSIRALMERVDVDPAAVDDVVFGCVDTIGPQAGDIVRTHGLKPRARIHHLSVRGADPVWMLTAPIPATAHALQKTGMTLADIDLV